MKLPKNKKYYINKTSNRLTWIWCDGVWYCEDGSRLKSGWGEHYISTNHEEVTYEEACEILKIEAMKIICIKVDPFLSEAVQKYWFSLGFKWMLGGNTVQNIDKPYLGVWLHKGIFTHSEKPFSTAHLVKNWDELVELSEELAQEFKNKEVKVELNSSNTAICTKSGIKVGCQDFSWDIVKKLEKAKKELES
jgi:hypothetical protein